MATLHATSLPNRVRLGLGTVARRAQALLNVYVPDFRIRRQAYAAQAHLMRDVGRNPQVGAPLPREWLVY